MDSLILPLGIINFLLILIQLVSGLRIIKIPHKAHRYFGIALGVFATIHGVIAVFFV
jgi:hypothetical protein